MAVSRDRGEQRLVPSSSPLLLYWMRRGSLRILLFSLLWWILTDGAMESWLVGVPVVLLVTTVSMILLPPFTCSLRGVVQFVPLFLWRSLRGGVDVAWRAFHPQRPLSPGFIKYRWHLPPGLPRVVMADIISLLPGTLSVELDDHYLHVHLLDEQQDFLSEVGKVEQSVAAIFAISLLSEREIK